LEYEKVWKPVATTNDYPNLAGSPNAAISGAGFEMDTAAIIFTTILSLCGVVVVVLLMPAIKRMLGFSANID
jgi:hypothetical protein